MKGRTMKQTEQTVADRLYAKGYRYQIRFPDSDIETLYAKTLLDATRVARDYSDHKTMVVRIAPKSLDHSRSD